MAISEMLRNIETKACACPSHAGEPMEGQRRELSERVSRRRFLRTTLAGTVVGGLVELGTGFAAPRAALAQKSSNKLKVQGSLTWVSQEKTIGNSEGAYFEQRFLRGQPMLNVTAIDVKSGQFESSNTDSIIPAQQIGFEALRGTRFVDAAVHATEQAQNRLGATPVASGP